MSNQTAFLVIDVQNGIVDRINDGEGYISRIAPVVQAAREAGIRLIYVRTSFRPGFPERHPIKVSDAKARELKAYGDNDESTKIHAAVQPAAEDPVVTKRRVSALASTDLDVILRCWGIQTLVLAGISTSNAILSTMRAAADLDYSITVLEDLCADPDDANHAFLMKKIFPRQAEVVSSADWLASLKSESA